MSKNDTSATTAYGQHNNSITLTKTIQSELDSGFHNEDDVNKHICCF